MTAEPAVTTVIYYFYKVQIETDFWLVSYIDQDGPVHGVATFFNFKTIFWVNSDVKNLTVDANG